MIGAGCHRLSEIADRLGKKAVNLSRPLANLVDLGYIRRELPFGESLRSTKRTLYKINDPFLNFYFKFLQPNKSLLEFDLIDKVYSDIKTNFSQYVAEIWENLVRESIPFSNIGGKSWKPAQRWWGKGINGEQLEIDLIAESIDEKTLLFGEVKWSSSVDIEGLFKNLNAKVEQLRFSSGYEVITAIWIKSVNSEQYHKKNIFTPKDVLKVLK